MAVSHCQHCGPTGRFAHIIAALKEDPKAPIYRIARRARCTPKTAQGVFFAAIRRGCLTEPEPLFLAPSPPPPVASALPPHLLPPIGAAYVTAR